jgi:hypothetical protein
LGVFAALEGRIGEREVRGVEEGEGEGEEKKRKEKEKKKKNVNLTLSSIPFCFLSFVSLSLLSPPPLSSPNVRAQPHRRRARGTGDGAVSLGPALGADGQREEQLAGELID